ncbi:DUF4304 domain-containing protein [Undibacterium seohonense]|jgi:hypothetical protein|uniref:DUF4304 domain-containing protein n=1 Tax=Undibacterium seohonense TaxID=1344950 RepID=A0ABR6X6B5_9BURK|nr:DUF4304 domain-containing protein [Undibacterium seohonense]MBC3808287.1 DUF4304 domain-containing protein [Undibacterium seohonense]
MNALIDRDKLFIELHTTALKPLGFKKKGHWVNRDLGDLTHSFYLRASRFGNKEHAIFWIDVQVFSKSWHELIYPERPYRGPSEGPSLLSIELGTWCVPPEHTHNIALGTDIGSLTKELIRAAERGALPLLSTVETPEALLKHHIAVTDNPQYLAIVGLSRLLGHEQQAFDYMQTAKRNAVHENALRFLEAREKAIWR